MYKQLERFLQLLLTLQTLLLCEPHSCLIPGKVSDGLQNRETTSIRVEAIRPDHTTHYTARCTAPLHKISSGLFSIVLNYPLQFQASLELLAWSTEHETRLVDNMYTRNYST
jgi:hypothetical protein